MVSLLFSTLERYPDLLLLWETLKLALALFVLISPVGGLAGWTLATRQVPLLLKWLLWGGVWSALLLAPLLLTAYLPPNPTPGVVAEGQVISALYGFALVWVLLYCYRLFAVTVTVADEQLYQMGANHQGARFSIVRPLLFPGLVASLAVVLLVLLFDSGVAQAMGLQTLSVGYIAQQGRQSVFSLWLAGVILALLLAWMAYRRLPRMERIEERGEKLAMGWAGWSGALSGLLLYLPLVLILRSMVDG